MNNSTLYIKKSLSYNLSFLLSHDLWWLSAWSLTLLRIPLLLLCLKQVTSNSIFSIYTIMLIVASDLLDGELMERSTKNTSQAEKRIRHICDAIGDRIVINTVLFAVLFFCKLNPVICLLIVSRETILSFVVTRIYFRQKIVLKANSYSKLGTVFIAVIVINTILPFVSQYFLLIPFVILSGIGLCFYAFKYEEC